MIETQNLLPNVKIIFKDIDSDNQQFLLNYFYATANNNLLDIIEKFIIDFGEQYDISLFNSRSNSEYLIYIKRI